MRVTDQQKCFIHLHLVGLVGNELPGILSPGLKADPEWVGDRQDDVPGWASYGGLISNFNFFLYGRLVFYKIGINA